MVPAKKEQTSKSVSNFRVTMWQRAAVVCLYEHYISETQYYLC